MSLMSASYPGYYNNNQSVPWRGVTAPGGKAVVRPVSVGGVRDTSMNGGLLNPGAAQTRSLSTPFVDATPATAYVESPVVFRYDAASAPAAVPQHNLGVGGVGTAKRVDEGMLVRGREDYGVEVQRKGEEESYTSSNAVAIPGSGQHSNASSAPGQATEVSPPGNDKRPTDIEKEINGQNLYKTELCRSFVETGMCRYGSKCQFAHGQSELRPVLRHPKYKTDFCKTFHTIGTCPYGTRCRFIHKRSEVEIAQNSIFLPPGAANPPEWSGWKDGNAPEGGKHGYNQDSGEKKSRSGSIKERRKTADVHGITKVEKNKTQRVNGRQRSSTDSSPQTVRRKNANSKKGAAPLGSVQGKHDIVGPAKQRDNDGNNAHEKGHRRRRSTGGNSSSPEGAGQPEDASNIPPVSSSRVLHNSAGNSSPIRGAVEVIPSNHVGQKSANVVLSPPSANHVYMNGHHRMNGSGIVVGGGGGGLPVVHNGHHVNHRSNLVPVHPAARVLTGYPVDDCVDDTDELEFLAETPEQVFLPPEVLQDPLLPVPLPDPVVDTPVTKEPARRRSSSSASRLPIFQELCTATEEERELLIGATASTVAHRVFSSSS